ncbi:MAG: D-alanine--D-alanine ligase [Myxococcaceae bacterium]|nr:D-alanine--D-alanine ligase [Myxococcaceae bacterium]
MGKRVGVLMGGWGEEKEISIKTGEAVAAALEKNEHQVTRVLAGPGLDQTLRATELDVAFLALHGRMGEDGKVQGLLEVMGLPYTGSGVMASALAMNKTFAKKLFRLHNLPTPAGYPVRRKDQARALELHGDLGFPCVVKPACGGSSVGVTVVRSEAELPAAVANACRYGGEALVERFIRGREITVGILGGEVLGSCEMAFGSETFDYQTKYETGAKYFLPPRLSATRVQNIEALAQAAYEALGCRGYARVDLIASESENDQLLEVNTLPGMTPMSLLPKIAAHRGMSFGELVERILDLAALDDTEVRDSADLLPGTSSPLPARRVG